MEKKDIAEMFSNMRLYEFRNVVFSFGQNLLWRRELIKLSKGKLLDVGTATAIIPSIYRKGPSVGLDISLGMLKRAKKVCPLVLGDGENLPFKDSTFDTLTVAFTLRNIPNKERAVEEFYRVLRKDGNLIILEMKVEKWNIAAILYSLIMAILAPIFLSSSFDYIYLLRSMLNFPDDEQLKEKLERKGFRSVKIKVFFPGITRLIYAKKCTE
jgi:Methylase involved in ubiquinone/menaquinone biosynthesis